MFDLEGGRYSHFAKGTKEQCEDAVKRMATLLNVEPTDWLQTCSSELETRLEANNRPLVYNDGTPLPKGLVLADATEVIHPRSENPNATSIWIGYDSIDDDPIEERLYFQAPEQTKFGTFERVILAQFNYRSWVVVNLELTHKETFVEGELGE
jgi:hypothetical protein